MSQLTFTSNPAESLSRILDGIDYSGRLFVLTDENTVRHCLPLLNGCNALADAHVMTIGAGDDNKNVDSLTAVLEQMTTNGATRHSLLINLGGGVVTDLGGFAGAIFKRGVRFINIPTTLLSAVDAAVGGKTGINFCGLKNEIGAFYPAMSVVISSVFYATLPYQELISGYGEVLKHALLDSTQAVAEALQFNLPEADPTEMMPILQRSVQVKERIVRADPYEHGLRRALNLGHTMAHAFESLAMERHQPLAHGVAVAHGLIVDLVLSKIRLGFPSDLLHQTAAFVREYYPAPLFGCKDYDRLIEFMHHDKKNVTSGEINFTLLEAPGEIRINCTPPIDDITAALDIARDLLT